MTDKLFSNNQDAAGYWARCSSGEFAEGIYGKNLSRRALSGTLIR
jgi:hypothetical protein